MKHLIPAASSQPSGEALLSLFCHGIKVLLSLVLGREVCLCEVQCADFSKVPCSSGRFFVNPRSQMATSST